MVRGSGGLRGERERGVGDEECWISHADCMMRDDAFDDDDDDDDDGE